MKKVFFALAALGFCIYSNTLHSAFVFDDLAVIVLNPTIRSLDLGVLWQAFNTRFIVGLSLAANYALGKENVMGYHFLNIFVHVLNSFLVYQLARLIFVSSPKFLIGDQVDSRLRGNDTLLAFFAALIFLSHPIQTQAVSYVWQRSTSMAVFFYLLSLTSYIRSRLELSKKQLILSMLSAVLGMFTKEIVFTLPMAILLYELCFLRLPGDKRSKTLLHVLPFILMLPIIPLTLAASGDQATLRILRPEVSPAKPLEKIVAWDHWLDITKGVETEKIPRREYMLTQVNVLRTYLRLLFLPFKQNVDYDYPKAVSLKEWPTFASLLLHLGLLVCAGLLLKRWPIIAFSIAWFYLTLSVESLISQKEFIFEHRLYLPMAGFSLFLVTGLSLFLKSPKQGNIVILAIAALFSFMTYQRNFVWKDEVSLWSDAIAKSPNKLRPYKNRGSVHQRQGSMDKAILDFNRAIELRPDDPENADTYSNRCFAYGMKGMPEEALRDCDRAVQLGPAFAEAYNNRAIIHKMKGDLDQALRDYDKAIELKPDFAIALNNRGLVYGTRGLLDQAFQDFDRALRSDPAFSEASNNRAVAERLKAQSAQL